MTKQQAGFLKTTKVLGQQISNFFNVDFMDIYRQKDGKWVLQASDVPCRQVTDKRNPKIVEIKAATEVDVFNGDKVVIKNETKPLYERICYGYYESPEAKSVKITL